MILRSLFLFFEGHFFNTFVFADIFAKEVFNLPMINGNSFQKKFISCFCYHATTNLSRYLYLKGLP